MSEELTIFDPGCLLSCGGTKDTQERDIRRARRLLKEFQDAQGNDRTSESPSL